MRLLLSGMAKQYFDIISATMRSYLFDRMFVSTHEANEMIIELEEKLNELKMLLAEEIRQSEPR